MRRIAALLIFLILLVTPVFSDSLTYVYGSSLSSTEMGDSAKAGRMYLDESGNLIALRSVSNGLAVFDKIISRGPYKSGSTLTARGPLHEVMATGGLSNALAFYSISTPLYPLYPVIAAGADYTSSGISGVLVMAGIHVDVPLSGLWNSQFTLILNGKLTGWGVAGVRVTGSVEFACEYGFGYRHNLGAFCWGLGVSWLYTVAGGSRINPYLGLGVDI